MIDPNRFYASGVRATCDYLSRHLCQDYSPSILSEIYRQETMLASFLAPQESYAASETSSMPIGAELARVSEAIIRVALSKAVQPGLAGVNGVLRTILRAGGSEKVHL
jgi:hypothetical protein